MNCPDGLYRLLPKTRFPEALSSRVAIILSGVSLIAALATTVVACAPGFQPPANTILGNAPGSQCGPLRTSGSQIMDAQGRQVTLSGVNWFGFETESFAPHGLSVRNYQSMLDQMVRLGFNKIGRASCSEGSEW